MFEQTLEGIDPAALTPAECVDALIELQRVQAHLAGLEQRLLAGAAVIDPSVGRWLPGYEGKHWATEELACALKVSGPVMQGRVTVAETLVHRLPSTLGLLESGGLDYYRARLIAEKVAPLDQDVTTELEALVLPKAATQNASTLSRALGRAVARLAPVSVEKSHQQDMDRRGVWPTYFDNGTAQLFVTNSTDQIKSLMTRLTSLAGSRRPGDDRTIDQRRSDTLMGLGRNDALSSTTATTTAPVVAPATNKSRRARRDRRRGPRVIVTVGLATLLGDDDLPAEVDGAGLIPASLARRIAADPTGTWRRLVTDPVGQVRHYGRTRYRPPVDLQEHVQVRDRHCRFPGCHRAAISPGSEIDHVIAWDDLGETNPDNLMALCARHHHLKHETPWTVSRDDDTGTVTWTSPQHRVYQTEPPPLPGPEPEPDVGPGPAQESTQEPARELDPDPPPPF